MILDELLSKEDFRGYVAYVQVNWKLMSIKDLESRTYLGFGSFKGPRGNSYTVQCMVWFLSLLRSKENFDSQFFFILYTLQQNAIYFSMPGSNSHWTRKFLLVILQRSEIVSQEARQEMSCFMLQQYIQHNSFPNDINTDIIMQI